MPSAGEIFDRIGWMLTTGAAERSRQAAEQRIPKDNAAVVSKAEQLAAPKKQASIGSTPEDAVGNVNQLFQSVLSPMLGVMGMAAVTPPPQLPEIELTPQKNISYNVSSEGKLSATVSPAPTDAAALRSRMDADFLKTFGQFQQTAPPGSDPMRWALTQTIEQEGRLPSNPAWLDQMEIDPKVLVSTARSTMLREIGNGADYLQVRNIISESLPNLSYDDWEAMNQELFNLLSAGNYMSMRMHGDAEADAVPPEERQAFLAQKAQAMASNFMQNYTPPKDRMNLLTQPTPPTGRVQVGSLPPTVQPATMEQTGLGPTDYLPGSQVGPAIGAQRQQETEETLIAQAEAGQLKADMVMDDKVANLENFVMELSDMSESINQSSGLWRLLEGGANRWSAWVQNDENGAIVADFMDARKSFLAMFARAFGEVGVLNEGDIARAEGTLPTIWDSQRVKDRKYARLKRFIAQKRNQLKGEAWRVGTTRKLLTIEEADKIIASKYSSGYSDEALAPAKQEMLQKGINPDEIENMQGLPKDPIDLFTVPMEE